jgi:hypothetical protein
MTIRPMKVRESKEKGSWFYLCLPIFFKTKYQLSNQQLESVKYIRYLLDKVIEFEQKRDELNLLATV